MKVIGRHIVLFVLLLPHEHQICKGVTDVAEERVSRVKHTKNRNQNSGAGVQSFVFGAVGILHSEAPLIQTLNFAEKPHEDPQHHIVDDKAQNSQAEKESSNFDREEASSLHCEQLDKNIQEDERKVKSQY